MDEDGEPFEVFGFAGEGRQHSSTALPSWPAGSSPCTCVGGRLIEEIVAQIQGIQPKWQPFWNNLGEGRSVPIHGLGDGIAHILKAHLKAKAQEREAVKADRSRANETEVEGKA